MQQNMRPLGFTELGHVQLLNIDGAVVEMGMHPIVFLIYIIHVRGRADQIRLKENSSSRSAGWSPKTEIDCCLR